MADRDVWPHSQIDQFELSDNEQLALALDPECVEWVASEARDMWTCTGAFVGVWAVVDGEWQRVV